MNLKFQHLLAYFHNSPHWGILTAGDGKTGHCHSEKITVDRGEAELGVDSGFWGVTSFTFIPSWSQHLPYYTKCYRNNRQHNIWFQNNPGQLSICSCSSLFYIFKLSIEGGQNILWTVRAFFLRRQYFFRNITHRQTISPVAKVYHVKGRGFMNYQVILLFLSQSKSIIVHESIIQQITVGNELSL